MLWPVVIKRDWQQSYKLTAELKVQNKQHHFLKSSRNTQQQKILNK